MNGTLVNMAGIYTCIITSHFVCTQRSMFKTLHDHDDWCLTSPLSCIWRGKPIDANNSGFTLGLHAHNNVKQIITFFIISNSLKTSSRGFQHNRHIQFCYQVMTTFVWCNAFQFVNFPFCVLLVDRWTFFHDYK